MTDTAASSKTKAHDTRIAEGHPRGVAFRYEVFSVPEILSYSNYCSSCPLELKPEHGIKSTKRITTFYTPVHKMYG